MTLVRPDAGDPGAVLRALRSAVLGAGPAVALGAPPGVAGAAADPSPDVPAGTALVVTTSGSTGYPKSVALSRLALMSSARATADRIGEGAWLLALPAGYIAGAQVIVRSLVSGREPSVLAGKFSVAAFAAATRKMASVQGGARVAAYTSLVPAQVATLLDSPEGERALASFEAVLVGGQALPPLVAERAAAAGIRLVRTYGSSETAGGCVYDGVPLDGVGVRIADGEVQVSGPTLADGYLGDPARTQASFVRDADGVRWYRTGDAGSFDGVLRVTGRIDNVLVSGGINVSLDRVEAVVRALPGLHAAVVVAVPDERWGEAGVVIVDAGTRPDESALADLRSAVEASLGAAARPREVIRIDRIPLLSSGKPDRVALRSLASARGRPSAGSA
ncbi:AMP-binding protein [Microbacterium sp.]|uniref:AMP-binding protein n=1 Tax=Microbacterium sp. TaxID=51671 RepID=UPI0025D804CE|nr:AMP-binding protein [Microbacterium sp.]